MAESPTVDYKDIAHHDHVEGEEDDEDYEEYEEYEEEDDEDSEFAEEGLLMIKQESAQLSKQDMIAIGGSGEPSSPDCMVTSGFKSELLNCSVSMLSGVGGQQQQSSASSQLHRFQQLQRQHHFPPMHQQQNQPQAAFCFCESCGAAFADSNLLEEHVLNDSCGLSLPSAGGDALIGDRSVNRAEASNDLGGQDGLDAPDGEEDANRCLVCSKLFSTRATLLRHMLTHTDQRSLKCGVCHKQFSQASYLKQHMLIHLGERPYSCRICGRTFTQSSTLKTHMFTHNNKESPHHCPTCGKTFTRPCRLSTHLLTHSHPRVASSAAPAAATGVGGIRRGRHSAASEETEAFRTAPSAIMDQVQLLQESQAIPAAAVTPENSHSRPLIRPRPPRLVPMPTTTSLSLPLCLKSEDESDADSDGE